MRRIGAGWIRRLALVLPDLVPADHGHESSSLPVPIRSLPRHHSGPAPGPRQQRSHRPIGALDRPFCFRRGCPSAGRRGPLRIAVLWGLSVERTVASSSRDRSSKPAWQTFTAASRRPALSAGIKAGRDRECAATLSPAATADVNLTLERLAINADGLEELDRRNLRTLTERHDGDPANLETLATAISESADTLQDTVEPYLIQHGFIERTAQGRIANDVAWACVPDFTSM